jgi:hypothetical protein
MAMYPETSKLNEYLNDYVANTKAACEALPDVGGQTPTRLVNCSLRDEAQKRSIQHREIADKAQAAAIFLHQHPEFDEFVRLVRRGAIQF